MLRREDDLPTLHAGIEGVARAKSELSPDRAGKNNLPFAGEASSHRKNILPYQAGDPNHAPSSLSGRGGRSTKQGSRGPTLMKLPGHTNPEMTMRYVEVAVRVAFTPTRPVYETPLRDS